MSKRQDLVLGRNVTEQAKAVERRGTVVLSIRVSTSELDSLSSMAEAEDKTMSQVVREAIRQRLTNRSREMRQAAVSLPNGSVLYFGDATPGTFTCLGDAKQWLDEGRHYRAAPARVFLEKAL